MLFFGLGRVGNVLRICESADALVYAVDDHIFKFVLRGLCRFLFALEKALFLYYVYRAYGYFKHLGII